MALEITTANFEQEVTNSTQTVLVDFWASWCGPCRMQAPILEAFAQEHSDIKITKCNVDDNPELAEKFFANGLGVEMDLGRKSYFVAFIFYQIGLYYEKVLKNLNAAIIYYTCAVRCNENCYQALFKQACAAAKRNRFREATEMFDEILILLSKGLELEEPQNWKYISAKEWQYLYKVNIWRAKIEWQCRGKTYTWQYLQGADLAVKAYRENGCLIELLEPDSLIYRDLIAYHVKSAPVQKLEKLLEIWKEISRMYEP